MSDRIFPRGLATPGVGLKTGLRPESRFYILIGAAFILSRVIFHLLGIEFLYSREINEFYQYLDPQELQHRLLVSLLYLHAQPPLFNLLLGVSFKLAGTSWHVLMQGLFLACGLALNLLLFRILRLLGSGAGVALAATVVYMVSPSQIFYENHLFYPYPSAMLVTMGVWCVLELASGQRAYAYGLGWNWALLGLLRSTYHVAAFLLPLWAVWRSLGARRALWAIGLPCLIVLIWYIKNVVLFGFFGSTSWVGMNMAKIAIRPLSDEQKQELLVKTGDPLALILSFHPLTAYPSPDFPAAWRDTPPAFSEIYKSNGRPNYNYAGYLESSRRYKKLSEAAIHYFPESYLKNVGLAFCASIVPSERYVFLQDNISKIGAYVDWYDLMVWLAPYPFVSAQDSVGNYAPIPSLTCLFLFPVSLMYWWKQCWKYRYWQSAPARFSGLVYMTLLIGYTFCVGNLFELGENNRFRFDWEPLMVALMVSAPFQRRAPMRLEK